MKRLASLPMSIKLPLLAAAMMILAGTLASQVVLRSLARVQDARIQELAQMHVEGLTVALGSHVLRKDVWEVYDTLDRASKGAEGRRMSLTAVADERGRVLAATDPRRVPIDSDIADLVRNAVALDHLSIDDTAPVLNLLAPLVYQGRMVGQIATELDVSDLQAERRQALVFLILGNALIISLLALAGFVVLRRMLRPVTILAYQMTETPGEPHPIPVSQIPRGDGETARLARTYNAMVTAVAAKAETERRLAERERFVALGRLSSSLAHEINNPLGGLLNATDTIRNYPDRPEVVRKAADLLDRGLRHLRDVTRATLDQNRLDRQDLPLTREDFEDLKLLIQPEVSRMGLTLDWSVDMPAPAAHGLCAVPVRQIVLNLLLNACTAAGTAGRVGLAVLPRDRELVLQITNTGPEMSQAARERLLADGPVPQGGGVGLRLLRDLARQLNGRIDLARVEGVTCITVALPFATEAGDAAE